MSWSLWFMVSTVPRAIHGANTIKSKVWDWKRHLAWLFVEWFFECRRCLFVGSIKSKRFTCFLQRYGFLSKWRLPSLLHWSSCSFDAQIESREKWMEKRQEPSDHRKVSLRCFENVLFKRETVEYYDGVRNHLCINLICNLHVQHVVDKIRRPR